MFNVGTSELIIIFVLVILLLGPKKIPYVARTLGQFLGKIRKVSDDLKEEIEKGIEEPDKPELQDKAPHYDSYYDKKNTDDEKDPN